MYIYVIFINIELDDRYDTYNLLLRMHVGILFRRQLFFQRI